MIPLIVLRDFENAAYVAQRNNPRCPLIYRVDDKVDASLSPVEQQKQLNEKTWRVFIDSLVKVLGGKKYQSICDRYRFDPEGRMRKGMPLLAEHIELFSIGAGQLFTRDVKRQVPGTKIKALTRLQLRQCLEDAQPFSQKLVRYLHPMYIGGTPTDFRAWFVYDPLLMDKEKQSLFSDVQYLSFPAYLERMSKSVSNRELQEKQIIPAPCDDGELDYYRVYQKICTGEGLVAYALKPATADSKLKPLLLFRQTQMAPTGEDMVQSVKNDIWDKKIGTSGYISAAPQLDRLMSDPAFVPPGNKIIVAGYSLGAAHAELFTVHHHNKITAAHFYSGPSIDAESAERLALEIQNSDREQDPLKISIYRADGDFVHYTGEKHVGWNLDPAKAKVELIEVNHANREISVLSKHSFKLYDNGQLNYTVRRKNDHRELNNHLDNSKRGAEVIWYERMRLIWGRIAYAYIFVVYIIITVVQKLFGFQFLRSSRESQ